MGHRQCRDGRTRAFADGRHLPGIESGLDDGHRYRVGLRLRDVFDVGADERGLPVHRIHRNHHRGDGRGVGQRSVENPGHGSGGQKERGYNTSRKRKYREPDFRGDVYALR